MKILLIFIFVFVFNSSNACEYNDSSLKKSSDRLYDLKNISDKKFSKDYSNYYYFDKDLSELWNNVVYETIEYHLYDGFLLLKNNKKLFRKFFALVANGSIELKNKNGLITLKSKNLEADEVHRLEVIFNKPHFYSLINMNVPYLLEEIESLIYHNKPYFEMVCATSFLYKRLVKKAYVSKLPWKPPFTDVYGNLYVSKKDLLNLRKYKSLLPVMYHESAHLQEKILKSGESLYKNMVLHSQKIYGSGSSKEKHLVAMTREVKYSDRVEFVSDAYAFLFLDRQQIKSFVTYMKSGFVKNNRYKTGVIYRSNTDKKYSTSGLNVDFFVSKYFLNDYLLSGTEITRYFRPIYFFRERCDFEGVVDICDIDFNDSKKFYSNREPYFKSSGKVQAKQ